MEEQQLNLYSEDTAIGYEYRDKQLAELGNLIEQLRNEADEHRKSFFQPDMSSLESYEKDTAKYREQVRDMLGWPLSKQSLTGFNTPSGSDIVPEAKVTFVAKDDLGTIYRLEIEVGNGLTTYGLLFLPHTPGPHPLAISQHGGDGTPELCSGLYGHNNYNDMTRRVLKHGIAVFAPQLYLWKPDIFGPIFHRHHNDHQLKQLGSSIAAIDIYKIQRALDYLAKREDIDHSRIGMIGLSYGGFYTLFTSALDLRIKAAYSSCFINNRFLIDWSDFIWFNSGNRFLDAEICALIAPRFLHLEVGKRDELFLYESAQPEIEKVAELYEKLGKGDQFFASAFDGVHELDPDNEGIVRFCQYLLNQGARTITE